MSSIKRHIPVLLVMVSAHAALAQESVPAAAVATATAAQVRGRAPGERVDVLEINGVKFSARVVPMTGGPAKGAIVLVPGDGLFAGTSRGLGEVQQGMPAFGWSTWMPELESPPGSRADSLQASPPPAATPPTPETEAAPAADAAEAAADPEQQEASATSPATKDTETRSLEVQRTGEFQDWATRNTARLAAVVAAAAHDGKVIVVAEGAGAVLATRLAAEKTAGITAIALLDPVEFPGFPAVWPEGLSAPVLEVLEPTRDRQEAELRRTRANASGLAHYRQMVAPIGEGTGPGAETALVRKIRGWLRSLER